MRPAWQTGAGFGTLAVAGLLALNYPLLGLFDHNTQVFGMPLLFVHLFVVWTLLIAGLAVLCECATSSKTDRPDNGTPMPAPAQRHTPVD